MIGKLTTVRIQENALDYGSAIGSTAKQGPFLYLDSEGLNENWEEKDRSGKLIGQRISDSSVVSYDENAPAGNIQHQPRFGDIAQILMSHFQAGTTGAANAPVSGVGTYAELVFCPVASEPSFSSDGDIGSFATCAVLSQVGGSFYVASKENTPDDVYLVNVDEQYGGLNSTSNGRRFTKGIVDSLEISQRAGEDLIFTVNFKFNTVNGTAAFGESLAPPNARGSLTTWHGVIPSYKGTVTFSCDGTTFTDCIDSVTLNSSQNVTDRKGIGQQGICKISFGDYSLTGQVEFEFLNNDLYKPGDTGELLLEWKDNDNYLAFYMPNIVFTPFETNVNNPDTVMQTPTFKAYTTSGTAAVTVTVMGTFLADSCSLVEGVYGAYLVGVDTWT